MSERSSSSGNCFDAMEQILRAQLDGHTRLLQCVQRKREAIRTGQFGMIQAICNDENALLRKLTEVERRRVELANRCAAGLLKSQGKSASDRLTLDDFAALAPAPAKTRLLILAAQLREISRELKSQSSIVRSAAEALSRHMAGIAQSVHSALGRAGVYGNRGRLTVGAPVQSVVDLKT